MATSELSTRITMQIRRAMHESTQIGPAMTVQGEDDFLVTTNNIYKASQLGQGRGLNLI